MRINQFLGRKSVVAAAGCIIFAGGFFLCNYLVNTLLNIRKILSDISNAADYSRLSNAFGFSLNPAIYVLISLLMLFLAGKLMYMMYTSYHTLSIGQKGTARWAEMEEIKRQYRSVPLKGKKYSGKGGIPVSRYADMMYIDSDPVNNLIIGTTGSGKGEMFVVPCIDIYSRAGLQPSLIVTDPKLELTAASYDTLKERGYEVHVLNLVDPLNSMGYNPLSLITDAWRDGNTADAQMLTRTFAYSIFNDTVGETNAKSQFFIETATSLLTALILAHIEDCIKYGCPEKITMYSIINLFVELSGHKLDNKGRTELDEYFSSRPSGNIARLQFVSSGIAGEETKGNIYASMLSKLNSFSLDTIAKMASESTLRMADVGFGEKPVAVFIGIPDYDTSNHFLASVFIRQLYFELSKKATLTNQGKCRREVVFLLDEFGNIPPVESMDSIITVCRGRNIRFNLIVQSYSQLYAKYGTNAANTIIGNCANQIYILTIEKETAERYSQLLGSSTITTLTRHGRRMQLNKSVTESSEERPLLNANELMELHKGEFIVKRVMHRTDITGADILPYPIFNRGKSRMPYRYEYLQEEFDTSKRMPDGSYDETGDVDLHSIVLDAQTVMADIYGGNYEETEAYMLSERLTKDKLALIASELGAEISALNKMSNISLKEYMENQQFSDSQKNNVLEILEGAGT